MDKIIAFFVPSLMYAALFILNALLPARQVNGYINKPDSTEKMSYRLNGMTVFFVTVLVWFGLGYFHCISFDWLYRYRWYELSGAFSFGLIFSFLLVFPYQSNGNPFFTDFYLGRMDNVQFWNGRIDAKMWLYLVGAIVLELNVLSFTAHHLLLYGEQSSLNILVCASLLSFFVIDYLTFEEVHLYTYDLFAEKVGFKLGWGCLVFYPYFYVISLWSTVDLPNLHTPLWLIFVSILVFLMGWTLSRGANLQKYFFKKHPEKKFLWMKPETISDGDKSLLVNGFWGLSRHVNYLGEILMGIGIALSTGYADMIWPWLYPLYYVVLLFPRQLDDDKRCAVKYGKLWEKYKEKVPNRIIPFIY